MAQKFTNAARSPLMANISAVDTSLTIDIALSDLFPVADTGTDPVPTIGKDWFKIVLQNNSGQIEIVYVRTRTLGSASMTNLLRGQEGTTARGYLAGSIVGLRQTALDVENAMVFENIASAYGKTLVAAESEVGVKFRNEYGVFVPMTLNAADHAGAAFTFINPVSVVLPLASTCGPGTVLSFCSIVDGASVSVQAPDVFINEVTPTFFLDRNDSLILKGNAGNVWIPMGGSASLKYSSVGTFKGVKFKEEVVISAPTTLTAELHLGAQITIFNATPITLPIVSTFPAGTLILFVSRDNGASVLVQSPNVFLNGITTVFPMDAGDTLLLEANGGNNWFPIAGTALHKLLNKRNFGAYPSSIVKTGAGPGDSTTFPYIPSWATQVKVMFSAAGNTNDSAMRVQLGTSSGIKITEYQSTSVGGLSPVTERTLTSGMVFGHIGGFARSGIMTLDLMDPASNIWMQHHSAVYEGSGFQHSSGAGRVTLTGPLSQIRINTTLSTDPVNAGALNIFWE